MDISHLFPGQNDVATQRMFGVNPYVGSVQISLTFHGITKEKSIENVKIVCQVTLDRNHINTC